MNDTRHPARAHAGLPNSAKLGPKWIGPFMVERKVHYHAYEVNIPKKTRIHPVFNTGSLKSYHAKDRLSNQLQVSLAMETLDESSTRLAARECVANQVEYRVQWEGEADPTWEALENLDQVAGLIQEFDEK